MENWKIQEINDGVVFTAKIIPGSNPPTRTCGLLDGMLKIKVSAAPQKGKANQCLIKFLAEKLGVKKSEVRIISTPTAPVKRIQVRGLSIDTLLKKLNFE